MTARQREAFTVIAEALAARLDLLHSAIGFARPDPSDRKADRARREDLARQFIRALGEIADESDPDALGVPYMQWLKEHDAAFSAVGDKVLIGALRDERETATSAHAAYFQLAQYCLDYVAEPWALRPLAFLAVFGITEEKISELRAGMKRERVKVLGEAKKALTPATKLRKRGRPSIIGDPAAVYDEYDAGIRANPPLWHNQTGYLRARHYAFWARNPNLAKATLSRLLKKEQARRDRAEQPGAELTKRKAR
jgi:hypothetical protein